MTKYRDEGVRRIRVSLLPLSFLLVAVVTPAHGKSTLESRWPGDEVTVDGLVTEWSEAMTFLDREDVSIGALNDDEYLYFCMRSQSLDVNRQAVGRGLILRLTPKGGTPLNIRFPLGMMAAGGPRGRGGGGRDRDPDQMAARLEESLSSFELFESDPEDRQRITVDNELGIELKAILTDGEFVYELKIPLRHSDAHPYAIGSDAGGIIAVDLRNPEIDREAMRDRAGGGGPGGMGRGGMGGRGGGMGRGGGGMVRGGMGGGMGGPMRDMPDPVKIRVKLHLASQPGA